MSVALFIDPVGPEYASAIEAAAFVAEAALGLDQQLILSCGPLAALDISLTVFGRAVARTVEGGERRPSPIVLLPLIRDADETGIDERLRPQADGESSGTLADLVELGVFATREESGVDPFSDRSAPEAFVEAIRDREVSVVVGLGAESRFWMPTLSQLREIPGGRLIAIPEFSPPNLPLEDSTIVRVQRTEIPDRPTYRDEDRVRPEDDEFDQFIVQARRQAALTAALIEVLIERS